MKKTTSKKIEKMPSPNLVGSPKISVHWSVNSHRGQSLVLSWQLPKQLDGGCGGCGVMAGGGEEGVLICPGNHKSSHCKAP